MPIRVYTSAALTAATGNQNFQTAQAATPVVASGAGNVFLNPPAVPDPLDDEFKSGVAALNGAGGRGWSVVNFATGATMTRVGDVTQAAPALGANEYRSTLTASGMRVQLGSQAAIYKAVSGSLACYCHATLFGAPSLTWQYEGPCFFGVAPVLNNTTRRLFINAYNNGRNVVKMDLNQIYTTIAGGLSMGLESDPWGGYLSWNAAASQFWGQIINPYSERPYQDTGKTNAFAGFAPIGAGFTVMTPNAADTWVTLRTFRVLPVGVLPG